MGSVTAFIVSLLNLYVLALIVYVVLSWFAGGASGVVREIYRALGTICEPYLGLFRRFLPPIVIGAGGLDLSPLVAVLVLDIVVGLVQRLG
jgi:YggT family protein